MAFTAYRTWVTTEIVSAAQLNEQIRDNGALTPAAQATAAGQTVHTTGANAPVMVTASKYKTADETVNNSTALQNDDHLAWAVGASEVWAWRMFVYFTIASGNPGLKFLWTMPASGDGYYTVVQGIANLGSSASGANVQICNQQMSSTLAYGITGLTSGLLVFDGVFINSTNAGTVQFQWAQNSLVASDLKLKLGSYLDLKRLA